MYQYDLLWTEYGWIGAMGSEKGLRRITLPKATQPEAVAALGSEVTGARFNPGSWIHLQEPLQAHLQGRPVPLEASLDLDGVPSFTRAAWTACMCIPRGETRSYGWLAARAGRPGAARAAGQAMARNRFPLLVPCHRVVASDGALHGYGGGLKLKAHLLETEGWSALARGRRRRRGQACSMGVGLG